ncbi:MAG: hypothetical protein PHU56_01305 [Candidatus Pacebacteria bacterium]|nr:hypothetical protein [Candidatus Paceibacterota bacterium]
MMKFFDWMLVIAATILLGLVLAAAISDSWGGELRKAGQWQKNNVIEAPRGD